MHTDASLDLRWPIAGLFVVLGALLAGFGLLTRGDAAMYARSADINVNLAWGLVMLGTGLVFAGFAARAKRR